MTRTPCPARRRRAVLAALALAAVPLLRARTLRWGATDIEARGELPGDDLVPDPGLTSTRAITIAAAAADVWPWIVQLGQGRGGFYSYDALENLVGCRIHSADRIVAEWQDVAVGDEVRLHPDGGLVVARIDPGRALVLQGAVPMGSAPAPYDFTWAFCLVDVPDGSTRLVVRERYGYVRPWAPLLVEPVECVSFVMTERMLRGIRSRAESAPSR